MNKSTLILAAICASALLTACSTPAPTENTEAVEAPELSATAPETKAPEEAAKPAEATPPPEPASKTVVDTPAPAKPAAPAKPREVTSKTGLKYIDHVTGTGDAAKEGDKVEVHYTGWLYENGKRGSQFDSSVGGNPFPVIIGRTGVIAGWTEGLVGMKQGGKRELIIPPKLAYGERGFPGAIPPNSTLDFEVEVVQLTKQ